MFLLIKHEDYLDFARVVAPMSEKLGYLFNADELKRKKLAQSLLARTKKNIYGQIGGHSNMIFSKIKRYIKKDKTYIIPDECLL